MSIIINFKLKSQKTTHFLFFQKKKKKKKTHVLTFTLTQSLLLIF